MSKTAIIYTRVSSAGQVDGTSLASQEADLRDYCAKHGYEILEHFQDAGESAKTANRPGLIEALAFAKRNRPAAFIVHKLDRLARDTNDGLTIGVKLRSHNTELVSATEAITSDPVGEMVKTILLSVAQFDNQIRAGRCKRGMHEIARKGGWVNQAPLGYINIKRATDGLSTLDLNPEKAPFLISILKRLAAGVIDLTDAYRLFRTNGVDDSTASYAMRNKVYTGIVCNASTDYKEIKGEFPAIITTNEYLQIQALLTSKGRKRQKSREETPYRGLLICGECAGALTSSMSTGKMGKKYPFYWCHKCGGAKISGRLLDDEIKAVLARSEFITDLLAVVREELAAQSRMVIADAQAKETESLKLRQKAERMLEKLTDGWMKEIIDDATYRDRAAKLRREIETFSMSVDEKSGKTNSILSRMDSFGRILTDPISVFELLQNHAKRQFLEIMFGGFIVSKDKKLGFLNSNKQSIYQLLVSKNIHCL